MSYGVHRSSTLIKPASSLLEGLVCYYELDEASGMAVDVHRNIHLSENGTAGTDEGKNGMARTFTSAGGASLTAASQPYIQAGTGKTLTVCAWAYLTSHVQEGGILCRWGGSTSEFALWFNDSDRFTFSVNGGNREAATFGLPALDTWHFVMGWFDGSNNSSNVQVNDDGLDSSTAAEAAAGTSTLTIGAVEAGDRTFNGRIDGAGYWSRLLTPFERSLLYNAGKGLRYPFKLQ